jgi:hypothetical protein
MVKRSRLVLALFGVGAAGCAAILGIDDGLPLGADASLDAGPDIGTTDASDVTAVDVAPEAAFSPLSCGAKNECNFAAGQTCCRTGAATYACLDAGAKCTGIDIPCDRPEQCVSDAGPHKCCTTDVLTDAGTYVATSVACMPAAQCAPIPTHYVLCGDDSGADCPDGSSCVQSANTLPPFLICK